MLDNKDYCDYDTCVALRELGFTLDMTEKVYERNLMTNRYETIPKPLLYEAQKFLRKNKRVEVNSCYDKGNDKWFYYVLFMDYPDLMGITASESKYDSYEEALLEGIKQIIEILKNETEKIN